MIQDTNRNAFSAYLTAPTLPQAIESQNGKEPIDLLMGNTGTLVWCERPPSLKEFLQATSNYAG
ncbi:MAG: hypothetical protein J0I12_20290 [Candidatus Eremiobacteraeota bacterium]|nr:hypothetical protein [Candidatus Eremiobacteraeota bacterium]